MLFRSSKRETRRTRSGALRNGFRVTGREPSRECDSGRPFDLVPRSESNLFLESGRDDRGRSLLSTMDISLRTLLISSYKTKKGLQKL
mgnify:CR=1 FL=1